MTRLTSITKEYGAALRRLDEAVQPSKTEITGDAALKRFEFRFHLAWKTIRAFPSQQKGINSISPKDCIRQASRQGLITYDAVWLRMTGWRNRTVNETSQHSADEL